MLEPYHHMWTSTVPTTNSSPGSEHPNRRRKVNVLRGLKASADGVAARGGKAAMIDRQLCGTFETFARN